MDAELVARLRGVIPRLARQLNETSTGEGLTPTQYSVLALVRIRGPLGLTELTELEGLNPTMVSRIVKVLDERGLIRRLPDPSDMRAARVEVTPAGEQVHERVREQRTQVLSECLERLPSRTAELLLAAVPAMEALAEAVRSPSRSGHVTLAAPMPAEHGRNVTGISARRAARLASWAEPASSAGLATDLRESLMTHLSSRVSVGTAASQRSAWMIAAQGAAVLAVGMGVGRFAYTPILPLMEHQAGLSSSMASDLATVNYLGYLIGALIGIFAPGVARSRLVLRVSLLVVIATLALMPVTEDTASWLALRLAAGVASALLFVIATSAMLARLHRGAQHLVGWGFGGVGLGIALSGGLVLVLQPTSSWRMAWWGAAVLAAVLGMAGWTLRPEPAQAPTSLQQHGDLPRTHQWFAALLASYTLEGIGYIIAGTFLVAAISQNSPGWLGSGAWVLVGIAAVPAAATWAHLARRWPRPTLILVALVIQAVGIALPSMVGGVAPALISAAAFGSTFVAISSLALAIGAHLQFPRSVALLTAGYSTGQILGPLVVRPMLHHGYHDALLVAACIVLGGAVAAIALRVRFPHRLGAMIEPSRVTDGAGLSDA
jgi:DNA-binding MarR family transcriptional regulator/MFS family permease